MVRGVSPANHLSLSLNANWLYAQEDPACFGGQASRDAGVRQDLKGWVADAGADGQVGDPLEAGPVDAALGGLVIQVGADPGPAERSAPQLVRGCNPAGRCTGVSGGRRGR